VGHVAGRAGRRTLGRLLETLLPVSARVSLDAVRDVERVLLVRPNFRMGNALMTNAVVPALRERFPGARLEILAGDTTLGLLENLPLDAVHPMSRTYVGTPWRFVALFLRLRRRRFDVAVEAGMGSFSGGLYSYLSGARFRIGFEGSGERFLNVLFPRPVCMHAYDDALEIGAALGTPVADRPLYRVGPQEEEMALAELERLGLAAAGSVRSFVAVFVGGHLRKRWPTDRWVRLVRALDHHGVPFVVFLGPEEASQEDLFRAAVGRGGRVLPPRPLRIFAAVLARGRALVTPDSGPMHLGVALGVPTLALLQNEDSRFYEPRGSADRALVAPEVPAVVEMVLAHPAVRECLADRARLGHPGR